jgi:hypothetical protein
MKRSSLVLVVGSLPPFARPADLTSGRVKDDEQKTYTCSSSISWQGVSTVAIGPR